MSEPNPFEHQEIAWQPTPQVIERAQLTRFMRQAEIESFDELMRRSTEDVEWFTAEVLKFLDIRFDPPYEKLIDTSRGIEWTRWCTGGGLNISEMCLDRWIGTEVENQPAIIWEGEEGEVKEVSYSELLQEVEYCAAGLRANGIGKGDAVGIHLPMMIETVIALVAIARIGAIAVPVFSGYGVDAIASRFNAVRAKAFISCMGFPRRGKPVWAHMTAWEAASKCADLRKGIILDSWSIHHATLIEKEIKLKEEQQEKARKFLEENPQYKNQTGAGAFTVVSVGEKKSLVPAHVDGFAWNDLINAGKERSDELSAIEPTSAEDPLIILYTSGTTGKPKGIAHVHCGFPIKAAQDMAFGTDVGHGTRISWVTDIGWMMGPWLIYGALINGATMVLYDGAPDYPTPDRMWEFCARHKVEILGISPTLVRALATCGDDLPKKHDLSSLRAFASTGEPWNPDPWRWLFEKVGDSKLPIINYSGGTEISGGILMGNPLLPIKPCSFPAPCPGIAADVLDETGNPVENGKVGELAIRQPWIGMARGFWQEDERYLDTYWRRFPGIWVHGDWALRDEDGHWFILGRSDDTLKVAGKRVGPAEVESLLVAHPLVTEAAVIGVPDELKGTAMVAFCVLRSDAGSADIPVRTDAQRSQDDLVSELKALVAKDMGKPLTPSKIHFVSALPKTRNAKVMRRVIRSAYLGEDPGDLSALENPKAVDEIAAISQNKA